ncbi:MAG: hypothetical protein ACOC9Y_09955, partial [Chloroflexota bacterium]
MQPWEAFPGIDDEQDWSRIVAVERHDPQSIAVWAYAADGIRRRTVAAEPWIAVRERDLSIASGAVDAVRLTGPGEINRLCQFSSFQNWANARRQLREASVPNIAPGSPAKLFFTNTGATSFRHMEPFDVVRIQFDIETTGLDPHASDARIVLIAGLVNGENPAVFGGSDSTEAEIIDAFTGWLREIDPDVIEGHN